VYRAAQKESVPRGGLYGMPFPVLRNNIRRIVAFLRRAIDIKKRKHFARILFYDSRFPSAIFFLFNVNKFQFIYDQKGR
jgi:hypothetical protein